MHALSAAACGVLLRVACMQAALTAVAHRVVFSREGPAVLLALGPASLLPLLNLFVICPHMAKLISPFGISAKNDFTAPHLQKKEEGK